MHMNRAFPISLLVALALGTGVAGSASNATITARGNEPGWNVTIGETEIEIVTDYGSARAKYPRPAPETDGTSTRYVVQPQGITITLETQPCADSMSGMFFPLRARVERPEGVLEGCGGEPSSLLTGKEWNVEMIGDRSVVANSRVTLTFAGEGAVFGNASCNNFRGAWTLSGEGLAIGPVASTMMACETEALSRQEFEFTRLLEGVARFEIAPDGSLVLLTQDGRKAVARR